MAYPILYSLHNCPYALRARLAVLLSGVPVNLRAIVLKNKPAEMVSASPKAEVPVLILGNGQVIDQSLDIMLWVLG
ncbi:MAG: glutathione S-transferase N-terminal domain-containing protein, partial [Gammaproteobacteria bacterium]|nr:glutathione S-transferase N-terminal domain-containing protein [Gammaproteobacteria bacterium]